MKKIKLSITLIVVILFCLVPINLKNENVVSYRVIEDKSNNCFYVWLKLGGTVSSHIYTDLKYKESECEIHLKGATTSLSKMLGSIRTPGQIDVEDKKNKIEKIYIVCSDGRKLIYEKNREKSYQTNLQLIISIVKKYDCLTVDKVRV